MTKIDRFTPARRIPLMRKQIERLENIRTRAIGEIDELSKINSPDLTGYRREKAEKLMKTVLQSCRQIDLIERMPPQSR